MVYGSQHVYVRRRGTGFKRLETSWLSDEDLMMAAKTIGCHLARRLDANEPILDARVPNKSRTLSSTLAITGAPASSRQITSHGRSGRVWFDRSRDLVCTSLRMNPRWIIVGEVRSAQAWTWFALYTGHCGARTIHANSAYDSLLALESLILQSGLEYPLGLSRKWSPPPSRRRPTQPVARINISPLPPGTRITG